MRKLQELGLYPVPPFPTQQVTDEVMRILQEIGLYPPSPTPAGTTFYVPDYDNRVVTSIPISSEPAQGIIGEFEYTVPDNGYLAVSGMTNSGNNASCIIMMETNGSVIISEGSPSGVSSLIMVGRIPVEQGRLVKTVFSVAAGGTSADLGVFENMYMTFFPLKAITIAPPADPVTA